MWQAHLPELRTKLMLVSPSPIGDVSLAPALLSAGGSSAAAGRRRRTRGVGVVVQGYELVFSAILAFVHSYSSASMNIARI